MCRFIRYPIKLRRPPAAGFTLLELLVALFIIGIALGAVGIAIGAVADDKRLDQQANKLMDWLHQTRKLALISRTTYRIQSDESGRIWVQDYRDDEWQLATIDYNQYRLPESLRLQWRFTDEDTEALAIHPDFTYTAFDLMLRQQDNSSRVIIGNGIEPLAVIDPENNP